MSELMEAIGRIIAVLREYLEYKEKYETEKGLREEMEVQVNQAIKLIEDTLAEISE